MWSLAELRTIAVALLSAAFLSSCAASSARAANPDALRTGQPWTMYQRVPTHNAVVARPGFRARWVYDAKAKINGGIAVSGDVAYVNTFAKELVALDVRTGQVRWEARTDNIVMSTPVVGGGLVYIGTGHNGSMTAAHSEFAYGVSEHADMISPWGRPEGDHLLAFDARTGAKRWSYRTEGEDMPSPVLLDGAVFFANGDLHAYSLDAKTGAVRWATELGGIATMASANVAQNAVILGLCTGPQYQGRTIALVPRTGAVRWRAAEGDCDAAPAVAGGKVFVSGVTGLKTQYGYGARGTVAALSAASGKVLWRYTDPVEGPYSKVGSSERAVAGTADGGVYYQSIPTSDTMYAFDAETGARRWSVRTQAPVKMSPVIANGRVFFGDGAGLLYQVDARTGRLVHVDLFDEPFATAPPVLVGRALLLVAGTHVYARSI